MKAALYSLGCKVNQNETQGMRELLEADGWEIVPFEAVADAYIINTCSVTAMSESKSRQIISRARKHNPQAKIIVTGCYAQRVPEEVLQLGITAALGNGAKNRIAQVLRDGVTGFVQGETERKDWDSLPVSGFEGHTRAYVKIQDGCDSYCTYCIIPYLRGHVRSRDEAEIICEVKRLVKAGFCEVVLTGIRLSSYDGGLAHLILELDKIEGLLRVRLGSLEPSAITDEFVNEISKAHKLCPFFHLSLQSGCDTVLKRMNRRYTAGDFRHSCRILRQAFPGCALSTDIIVGFPEETDEEFNTTVDFVREIRFAFCHIFTYSKREGTVAAKMPQLPPEVKQRRAAVLAKTAGELKAEYLNTFMGKTVEVLCEKYSKNATKGLTAEHAEVILKGRADGRVAVKITGVTANGLEGEAVPGTPE